VNCVICFSLDATELAWDGVICISMEIRADRGSNSCADLVDPPVAILPHHERAVMFIIYTHQVNSDTTI